MALLDLLGLGGGAAMPDPNNNALLDQSALQRLLRLIGGPSPQVPAAWPAPQPSQFPPAPGYGGGVGFDPRFRIAAGSGPLPGAAAPVPTNLGPLPNLPPPPAQPLLSGAAAMPLPAQPGPMPPLGGLLNGLSTGGQDVLPPVTQAIPSKDIVDWLTRPGPAMPPTSWDVPRTPSSGMRSGSGVAAGYGVGSERAERKPEELPYPMEGRDIGRRQERPVAGLENRPPSAGPGGAPAAAQQPLLSKIDDFLHRNADTMLALAGGFGGARSIGQGIGRAGQLMLAADAGTRGLTEQALIARGVNPEEARALASNPTLLKERLPEIYPQPKFAKITDAQGNERYVLQWPTGVQGEPMELPEGSMRQINGKTYVVVGGRLMEQK